MTKKSASRISCLNYGSIAHVDHNLYSRTPEFLMIASSSPGKKLEDKVAAYGNVPGEGMFLGRNLIKNT